MKHLKTFGLSLLLLSGSVFAQDNHLMVGLISSHFHNFKADQRISEMRNPFSSGVLLGYSVNQNLAFSMTGQYMNGDMEDKTGDESMTRLTLSAHVFPFQWNLVKPYVSGGLVYTRQSLDSDLVGDEVHHFLQLRQSLGLDVMLFPHVSLNFDMSVYSDGLNYLGEVNSFGLRYIL